MMMRENGIENCVISVQGSVVDVVTSASHVIYPAPPPSQSPGDEFFRPVTVKGRNATVHWWYTPDRYIQHPVCNTAAVAVQERKQKIDSKFLRKLQNFTWCASKISPVKNVSLDTFTSSTFEALCFSGSYDNVIPSSELGGVSVETPPTKQKQWWVSSRWLTDSDLYNEWMNEEDYELLLWVRPPPPPSNLYNCFSAINGVFYLRLIFFEKVHFYKFFIASTSRRYILSTSNCYYDFFNRTVD